MQLLATLTATLVVGAIVMANLGVGTRLLGFVRYIPGQDVTAHFLLYGALGLTVSACLRRSVRPAVQKYWAWFVVGLAVLAVAEEFSQAFISTRSFSIADMAASLGGLVVGALSSECFADSGLKQSAD